VPHIDELHAASLGSGAEPRKGAEPRMHPTHHIEAGLECGFQVVLPVLGQLPARGSDADDD